MDFVSLETMVPQDRLLRKIGAASDFKKIYEFVEELYYEDNGRPWQCRKFNSSIHLTFLVEVATRSQIGPFFGVPAC